MEELFEKLAEGCLKYPNRYLFNPPATKTAIRGLERKLKLQIPASYRSFLLHFNGGFICDRNVGEDLQVEDAAWNSNFLHGLSDIEAAFTRTSGRWKRESSGTLYIPFCSTADQETLVFRNPLDDQDESPVIDAWHEAPPVEWETVYESFAHLLKDYIEKEGAITTIA